MQEYSTHTRQGNVKHSNAKQSNHTATNTLTILPQFSHNLPTYTIISSSPPPPPLPPRSIALDVVEPPAMETPVEAPAEASA